jgi:hypothetical protein
MQSNQRTHSRPSIEPSESRCYWLVPVISAVVYLTATQLIFDSGSLGGSYDTLTLAFMGCAPLAAGALSIHRSEARLPWVRAVAVPCLAIALALTLMLALGMQSRLRTIIAIPPFFMLACIGGVMMGWLFRSQQRLSARGHAIVLIGLLVLPYALVGLERRVLQRTSLESVYTHTQIAASPQVVWDNIICVPTIDGQDEHFPSLVLWLGVPRPRAAILSHEGTGGVRSATFDEGMTFVEEITDWVEGREISFTIDIESQGDVAVAGEIDNALFEVLDATYRVEAIDDQNVILHLESRQSITSGFNAYGGIWTELMMRSLQEYVLRAIKTRAETEQATRGGRALDEWCQRDASASNRGAQR